jgi:small subunit ribosomal protein S21
MPKVTVKHKNESFDQLFRRFKRASEKADLPTEIRNRAYYEKPSTKRKRAKAAAIKRAEREQASRQL